MYGKILKKDRGFALVVVIVVMLMISFLASQLILQVRTELKIATNRSDHIIERMLAEGGVNMALFRMQPGAESEVEDFFDGPFKYGKIYESVFPEGKIEYYAVSEAGKINLNANPALLLLFLEHFGLDDDERAIIQDSLADWTDVDDLYQISGNGAESDYYESLDRPYLPRNGKISDPGEFFLIRGTERLKGMFDPYEVFTVHNRNISKINFNSLTPAMLDFLTAGDQESKDLYWELREDAISLSGFHAQQVLDGERYALFGKHLDFNPVRNNSYYSIVATGWAIHGSDIDPENDEDDDMHANKPGKKKKGVKVTTLVDSNGSRVNYLSWRASYT